MIIEKNYAGIIISDIKNGQRVRKLYIGYKLAEAKKAFKEYLKTL